MIVAAKQSWNAWIPELKKPHEFSKALPLIEGCCIVADEKGKPFNTLSLASVPDTISCFIGPPGGFSEEELAILQQHDTILITLAKYRLRTELAAAILAGNILQKFVIPE
jgi:16S rRNA (uracil1498-N3)-methyltransferase